MIVRIGCRNLAEVPTPKRDAKRGSVGNLSGGVCRKTDPRPNRSTSIYVGGYTVLDGDRVAHGSGVSPGCSGRY
jgi:hypothetical protein